MLITLTHINNNVEIRNEILDSRRKEASEKASKQASKQRVT